jgi:hypothetical protein
LLGEVVLAQGDVRTARDLLERALLIAPGYRFALDVEAQLKAVTRR